MNILYHIKVKAFILFWLLFSGLNCSKLKPNIKYIGFDIHEVLVHINPEKCYPQNTNYHAIVTEITKQLISECKLNQEYTGDIVKNVVLILRNSMPKIIASLSTWVPIAIEQYELGKNWFSKRSAVTNEEMEKIADQIIRSDIFNQFVDKLLDSCINNEVTNIATQLNKDKNIVANPIKTTFKNGLIKRITLYIVKNFFDNEACTKMAEPIEPMVKLLKILKNKGFLLFIISNAASGIVKDHYSKKMELSGLFNEFEEKNILVSGDIGLKKPDEKIFKYAADKIGFDFSECLFIDDEAPNIASANKTGITGVCFDRTNISNFLGKLRELSIINDDDIKEVLEPMPNPNKPLAQNIKI